MAAYLEIFNIKDDPGYGDLVRKITVAVGIKAHAIAQEATPTAAEITWAKEALTDPNSKRKQIEHYLFAENNTFTIAQMIGASDAAIQSAVNAAVDNLLSK